MKLFKLLPLAVALCLPVFGSLALGHEGVPLTSLAMKNAKKPAANLITGGQPALKDLQTMAASGVKVVINLRTKGEFGAFDEAAELAKLGVRYELFEIDGGADITKANAIKLDALLNKAQGKVLVHCASSNRVGALLALREFYIKGQTAEQAMAFGRSAGMSGLTETVAKMIK